MSKIFILSAGTSPDSYNNQLAKHLSNYFETKGVENVLFDNLYSDIPFLLDTYDDVPQKIIEMRKSLEESGKIIIFSPVYNGGFLAHLKNTLDWLSLAYDDYRYSALFREKKVAVVTTVKGAGGNAQKAFEILSMQLSNYNLLVFEKFHLITKLDHQNEKSILNNQDIIESLKKYAEEFLDI
tara:strand:+ start:434 stop:979 length:546 start_codon:yes stop_codon:yes gene_type:complete